MGPPPFSGSKHSKLALNEHSESGHQKNAQNPKTPKPHVGKLNMICRVNVKVISFNMAKVCLHLRVGIFLSIVEAHECG